MQDDLDAFRIRHPAEVTALLVQLRDSGPPVVLAAPNGTSLGTHLWSIDPAAGRLQFGVAPHALHLDALIAADEVVAVSHLQSIQVQFSLHGLTLVRGDDQLTLQADWPDAMLRLQRRDNYRVRPDSGRASPAVSLRHPSMPDMQLMLRVIDVSAGGCALLLPADVPDLQPGTHIQAAQAQLDLETRFQAGLRLHHVSSVDGSEGSRRIGCSWADLTPGSERALQRYILQTQKRQRLLGEGHG